MRLFFNSNQILEYLKKCLSQTVGEIPRCAYLGLPNHHNAGDWLISIGTLFYLKYVLKAAIDYSATAESFSEEALDRTGEIPILMQGGGNLGDLWPTHEEHRQRVISANPRRRIIVFPQSIYFADRGKLEESSRVYNAHPDLTLFVRDEQSLKWAEKHFGRCKIVLAPDMAFFLLPKIYTLLPARSEKKGVLFLSRGDQEKINLFASSAQRERWVSDDWASFAGPSKVFFLFFRHREPLFDYPSLPGLPRPWIERSWDYFYRSLRQLRSRPFVLTDRLHGHILSLMLEIPHFLLPNSYHKNESFFQTWSRGVPHACFVKEPRLLEKVPAYPRVSHLANRLPVPEVSAPKRIRISYCTPCRGRLGHLKRTFLRNLEDNANWPEAEFVLVNYGGEADLDEWVRRHLKKWIDAGRVVYSRTGAFPYFHMAHAKNVAHRLASGEIVCNLDADNFTGKEFTPFLWDLFEGGVRRVAHGHWKVRLQSTGRVALRKNDFMALGGYDESYSGWGSEDLDLLLRALDAGMERFLIPDARLLRNILHGDKERVRFFPEEGKNTLKTLKQNRNLMLARLSSADPVANRNISWGRARVYVNFAESPIDVGV